MALFFEEKNEVLNVMKKCNNLVETKIGFKLKALLIDHKGIFLSQAFSNFCNGLNIIWQLIQPKTLEQNDIVEEKK